MPRKTRLTAKQAAARQGLIEALDKAERQEQGPVSQAVVIPYDPALMQRIAKVYGRQQKRQRDALDKTAAHVYGNLFPWFGAELVAAGWPQAAPATAAVWSKAHDAWEKLTKLPALRNRASWLTVPAAAGFRAGDLDPIGTGEPDGLDRLACGIVAHVKADETQSGQAAEPDGPLPPDGFAWGGEVFRGLPPKPFAALGTVWPKRGRSVHLDELAGPVWGDREDCIGEQAGPSIRKALNLFFGKHKLPFRARFARNFLSILDSEPTPKAGGRKRKARPAR